MKNWEKIEQARLEHLEECQTDYDINHCEIEAAEYEKTHTIETKYEQKLEGEKDFQEWLDELNTDKEEAGEGYDWCFEDDEEEDEKAALEQMIMDERDTTKTVTE